MSLDPIIEMLVETKQNRISLNLTDNEAELSDDDGHVTSKWGGFPDLPPNFSWPMTSDAILMPREKQVAEHNEASLAEAKAAAAAEVYTATATAAKVASTTAAASAASEQDNACTASMKVHEDAASAACKMESEDASAAAGAALEAGESDAAGVDEVAAPVARMTALAPEEMVQYHEDGHPLSFLLQINLAQVTKLDSDEVLPQKGVLSFFFDLKDLPWGYEHAHRVAHRVYYFEDVDPLEPASPPLSLDDYYILKESFIKAESEPSILSWDDFSVPLKIEDRIASDDDDKFAILHATGKLKGKLSKDGFTPSTDLKKMYYEALGVLSREMMLKPTSHQLLGHASLLSGNITEECELVSRGYSYGEAIEDIPDLEVELAAANSLSDWQLLLELELSDLGENCPQVSDDDITRLYIYILKDDLYECNFSRTMAIIQSV